jgi:four helix bundle protein
MQEFTDLEVWREAHKLTLVIYALTRRFPADERFALTTQIQRAVVSIESNIAEGFGRFSQSELHHFCNIARGSLAEVQCQLMVARDLGHIPAEETTAALSQAVSVRRLLHAFMKSLRSD